MANYNNFYFIGKLNSIKENDKFKAYQTRDINGEYVSSQFNFNVICGDNRHQLRIDSFINKDINNTVIKTIGNKDKNGKYPKLDIPFKDRETRIVEVAPFKKFILDTDTYENRNKLNKLLEKLKNGTVTDEEKEQYKVNTVADIEKLISESLKKKQKFIHEYDFLNAVMDIITENRYKDKLFKVQGDYKFTKSKTEDKYYVNYVPTKVIMVEDNTECVSDVSVEFVFGDNVVETITDVETEKNTIKANGFLVGYDYSTKKDMAMPFDFEIPEAKKRMITKFEKPIDSCAYRVIGLVLKALEGSQSVDFTKDMLTDEQKEDIECGLLTFDDVKKEMGKGKGEFIKKFVFEKIRQGYTGGSKETVYTDELFGKNDILDSTEDIFDGLNDDDLLGIEEL